jgi:hypothetical protein
VKTSRRPARRAADRRRPCGAPHGCEQLRMRGISIPWVGALVALRIAPRRRRRGLDSLASAGGLGAPVRPRVEPVKFAVEKSSSRRMQIAMQPLPQRQALVRRRKPTLVPHPAVLADEDQVAAALSPNEAVSETRGAERRHELPRPAPMSKIADTKSTTSEDPVFLLHEPAQVQARDLEVIADVRNLGRVGL